MPGNGDVYGAFIDEWTFTRRLSRDLLAEVAPGDLYHAPSDRVGPLWKQFRHLGRLDECYLEGLDTGVFDFEVRGTSERVGPDKAQLDAYLLRTGGALEARLRGADRGLTLDWAGTPISFGTFLTRILGHETFHHGELVVYVRSLKRAFPESWQAWGV